MKLAAIAALAAVGLTANAHAQAPAGWKVIKDTDKGKCQMSVPADWKQQEIMGKKLSGAAAPDKGSDALVNLMDGANWDTFQSIVYSIYTKEKSRPKIEDGKNRLWFEIVGGAPGMTSWYVAVPAGDSTCNAQLNFKKGDKKAEELARQVAQTIRGG